MSSSTRNDAKLATSSIRAQRFHKTLGRLDIVFLSISAVISIDTVAQIAAGGGAEAFTWTAVIGITFLFPYALVISELGSTFHDEGGPFVWVRLAFGKLAGAIATLFYWITNPLWMGGSLVFISAATWGAYIAPLPEGSAGDIVFKLVFIWLAIGTAIIGLRYGKHIVAAGAVVKIALLLVFVVTVVVYAMKNGVHGYAAGAFSPTLGGFLAVTPVILFAVVGFEAPNGAAEEMRNPQKDVPKAIASSGIISILCYLVPIFAILAVLPADKVQGASGLLDAFKEVFSVYGIATGPVMFVAALLFVFVVLTQASAWMIASDRVQAAAGADGAFFRYFGVFSKRFGTPVRMNLLSGIVATVFCVAATLLLKGSTAAVFTVVLTVAISTLLLSYLVIFPSGAPLPRPRRPRRTVDRGRGHLRLGAPRLVGGGLPRNARVAVRPQVRLRRHLGRRPADLRRLHRGHAHRHHGPRPGRLLLAEGARPPRRPGPGAAARAGARLRRSDAATVVF